MEGIARTMTVHGSIGRKLALTTNGPTGHLDRHSLTLIRLERITRLYADDVNFGIVVANQIAARRIGEARLWRREIRLIDRCVTSRRDECVSHIDSGLFG